MHKALQDKKFYEQYVLFDLNIFVFLLSFYTKKYIHYDRKPHIFSINNKIFKNL